MPFRCKEKKTYTKSVVWEECSIKEVAHLNPMGAKLPPRFNYIDLESVKGDCLLKTQFINISDAPIRAQRFLMKGDILFQTVRPYQKNNLFFNLEGGDYVASTGYIQLRPLIDNKFLYYVVSTDSFVKEVLRLCVGSNYPAITSSDFSRIILKVPSPPEQKAIVSIIEKWDRYLELLDKKIEIKNSIKRHLKNGLLKGSIRLDGYQGDWEEKKLGEIGEFKTSSVDKKIRENEKIVHLVNYMDVYKHKNITIESVKDLMVVSVKPDQLEKNNLVKGDVLFTPSSETPDDIGHSIVIRENLSNVLYSYHLVRFRPNIKLDLDFAHYFCNHSSVLRQFSRYSSGVTRFTLSLSSFATVKVLIPPIQEQKAISSILSNSDKEIKVLQKQKSLIEQQRKYLINNLVTGNIRLPKFKNIK